ncbi:STAS domain-containing protein [Thiocystis violascens]|uniref:Anti-anti-sigma regulatory factor (Antagonist of anti-sigma factor) n=1 Tax=Thiocystis violascens (strain ATCC 17096 / DSM 198 / 6111) TaxID=765911 RepID=I3YG16_THIV6|nr:STAS domain-containing protein [Thiocystis violascens]AFL75934.1 anti-anti-sigma regulatory factor (antagonist of anti-sigma factor) [Thiocystis violascens DSM 198]
MSETNGHPGLRLEGEVTIYNAIEIKLRLLETLARAANPEVDLSAVTELDTAGLQLLLLGKQEAARLGKTLRYLNHSPAVVEILDFCNLIGRFGDPVVLVSNP